MAELIYKEESFRIQGAIFEVYNHMGPGFLEAVYHECLEREFAYRNIAFQSKPNLVISYKATPLSATCSPDFVCDQKILIEIKAQSQINPIAEAQVLHYLKATGLRLGLLVNFGDPTRAVVRRFLK
jgi:GxxExxY protein